MRRLRISGQVISSCFAFCAAAILMIGLAAVGHSLAGRSPRATRASNGAGNPLLHATAAQASAIKSSKTRNVSERYRQFPLRLSPTRRKPAGK